MCEIQQKNHLTLLILPEVRFFSQYNLDKVSNFRIIRVR